MIDCGEGTQMRLMQLGIRHTGLDYICISHLHGDHYYGLIGLISSMNLLGRKNTLHIIGPPHLKEIIDLHLKHGGRLPGFEINYFVTNPDKETFILKTNEFELSSFPLKHKIHCTGFLIKEAVKERPLNLENIEKFNVPMAFFKDIKKGNNYINDEGDEIPNTELSFEPKAIRSYAYCCDTIFDIGIVDYVKDCTVLYHEATYMDALKDKAAERFHSTARQAAIIAKNANAKQLLIGHFSSRYDNLEPLLMEAKTEFAYTSLATEGLKFLIDEISTPPLMQHKGEFTNSPHLN